MKVGFFLQIWYSLPMGWRYALMPVPLVISIVASFFAPEPWVCLLFGAVASLALFLLPGPSQSERNGYNF